jgi:hypothetical protein
VTSARRHAGAFGVGNGLGQPYHHCILPLRPYRDKVTQLAWGIADFRHRFGYRPDGFWLPEMAVDTESLVALVDRGIQYTLLSQQQVRHRDGSWVSDGGPYHIMLPHNRHLTVFVRNDQLSNRLAFDPNLTEDARLYAEWCRSVANGSGLYLIATEGETFGHHQANRHFFLASLLRNEAAAAGFAVTTPGAYQRGRPAEGEVVLHENTSWSCAHGTARWATGCPCTPGDQHWKARLHTAMNRLVGGVNALYQAECRDYLSDPWAVRDSYISVLLGRSDVQRLLQQFASHAIPTDAAVRLSRLLDAQWYCQAMFSSSGWFFEDLSRFETRTNIGYASMAIEQVQLATRIDLAPGFRDDLSVAKSWITDETGRELYDRIVAQRCI